MKQLIDPQLDLGTQEIQGERESGWLFTLPRVEKKLLHGILCHP